MAETNLPITFRNRQIFLLKGLLGKSKNCMPSSIFIYGTSASGKSLVLSTVLEELQIELLYGNCIEFYYPRLVYESYLNQINDFKPCKKENYSPSVSCENMVTFVNNIIKCVSKNKRYVFVLDRCERLRDCDIKIFPSFCRLQELCHLTNICSIFLSRVPYDKFLIPTGCLRPLIISFPQYTKDEIIKVLVSMKGECCLSDESYHNYISLILHTFYFATRNINELKRLAELNLSKYCAPIERGAVSESEIRLLWKNIEPSLKKCLSTVYLREMSSDQFVKMQELTDANSKEKNVKATVTTTKIELPFYSKFLVIASYLASYNPASSDRRFFSKSHTKKRKGQASIKAKQRSCSQMTGPKTFALNRMLAIFYAIIDVKVALTSHLFSQVTSLVSLRLILLVGSDDVIGSPKYKCNVAFDFVKQLSKSVNFDISEYLYDIHS